MLHKRRRKNFEYVSQVLGKVISSEETPALQEMEESRIGQQRLKSRLIEDI
jgi:hypothetical protein